MALLRRGGCGGQGALYGCYVCKQVYQQVSGGLLSSKLFLEPVTHLSMDDMQKEEVSEPEKFCLTCNTTHETKNLECCKCGAELLIDSPNTKPSTKCPFCIDQIEMA